MGRPRKCPICTADSAIKLQIDALLMAGVSIKTVVSQVAGYSRDQLSRHKHRCLQPQPVPKREPESSNGTGREMAGTRGQYLRLGQHKRRFKGNGFRDQRRHTGLDSFGQKKGSRSRRGKKPLIAQTAR